MKAMKEGFVSSQSAVATGNLLPLKKANANAFGCLAQSKTLWIKFKPGQLKVQVFPLLPTPKLDQQSECSPSCSNPIPHHASCSVFCSSRVFFFSLWETLYKIHPVQFNSKKLTSHYQSIKSHNCLVTLLEPDGPKPAQCWCDDPISRLEPLLEHIMILYFKLGLIINWASQLASQLLEVMKILLVIFSSTVCHYFNIPLLMVNLAN